MDDRPTPAQDPGRADGLELVVAELPMAPWVVAVADEMVEDPRCHRVELAADGSDAILVTIWDADAATEVAAGLTDRAPGARVRRARRIAIG